MNAASGEALPLKNLQGLLIASPSGEVTSLATWSNGMPALSQLFLGEGRVFLLSTLPIPTWSNMENLALHLILIQRLLQEVEAQNRSGYQQVLSAGRAPYKAQLTSEGGREVAINRAPQSSLARISKAKIRELLSAGNLEVASAGRRPMRPWLYPFLLVALFFIIIEAALQVWPPRFSFTKREVSNV